MMNIFLHFFFLLLLQLAAFAQMREIPSPASATSGQPNLTVAPNGNVYLSWIDRTNDGRAILRFARLEKSGWSVPQTIAEGTNWFVNWADFPSMIVLPDGSMAAHWLAKSGASTYAYDVHIARSTDRGKTWSKSISPHRDGTLTEHGFVSLLPAQKNSLAAIWLDGRAMAGQAESHTGEHGHGNMSLRYALLQRDNTMINEAMLDGKVCECCQTSAAITVNGPVVVYRDRADNETRDISIVRWQNGKWSEPKTIYPDSWQINGCPVNGPAIAATGQRVAVAWFTGANNQSRVKLAFSNNAGASFDKPIAIDDGNPAGRVDVLLLNDGSAFVCWLEKLPSGGAVRARRVFANGKSEPAITITETSTARASGFPQMARTGNKIIFAWTNGRVFTAEMLFVTQN